MAGTGSVSGRSCGRIRCEGSQGLLLGQVRGIPSSTCPRDSCFLLHDAGVHRFIADGFGDLYNLQNSRKDEFIAELLGHLLVHWSCFLVRILLLYRCSLLSTARKLRVRSRMTQGDCVY